jgi:hypothetical protein
VTDIQKKMMPSVRQAEYILLRYWVGRMASPCAVEEEKIENAKLNDASSIFSILYNVHA